MPEEIEAFEQFWLCCPRRIGKGHARKAWAKALKLTDAQTIIAGMHRYAEDCKWTEPRYIKHPATWLNSEGWSDEYEPIDDKLDTFKRTLLENSGLAPVDPIADSPVDQSRVGNSHLRVVNSSD
jgi:hypothetical protein